MPLIIITGLPSSGKTYRAQQIFDDFNSRIASESQATEPHLPNGLSVQLLASHHASLDQTHEPTHDTAPNFPPANPRDVIYNSAREEKTARAEEFSAVKRALSKNNIVIADAPNYIKGFRYQMWCEAKPAGTKCCVVHIAAREDECKLWNENRIKARGWDDLLQMEEENDTAKRTAKDTRGDLQPESPTAIYGDKLVGGTQSEGTRSRSSSMGGGASDDDDDRTRRDLSETMTLKSLYITAENPTIDTNGNGPTSNRILQPNPSASQDNTSPAAIVTTAKSEPPPPTSSLPYSPATLQSLSMRYEPPSPFTRWDTPLFTIPSTDIHPPFQAIWDALLPPPAKPSRKPISRFRASESNGSKTEGVRRLTATALPRASGADALQILESATADVVKTLLAAARENGAAEGEGGHVDFIIPDPKSGEDLHIGIEIPLNTILNQPSLQRLRRKYTQIQRGGIAHGQAYVNGRTEIITHFSRFLEAEWNAD